MVFESMGQFMNKLMFFHGYVNEFNGFPKPLTKEEEEKYVEEMIAGDASAREKLINHNMRLVAHVAKKYTGAAEADDLLSVGSIGLIKAIDSFRPEKGSQLSTYASRCIENEMLMLLRANKKHKVCISIDEPVGVDKDGGILTLRDIIPQKEEDDPINITERKMTMEALVSEMQKLFDDREFLIISLRYGLKDGITRTQREVAEILNISRSYISRIETKALKFIKEKFTISVEDK